MIINPYIYGVATSYDPDAQLFFNAQTGAGVTLTTTQMNAVNQWVVDAKAANIWTKFKAVYPIVGGSPTSHKFNLKNPLDTNAAFRLAFVGGGTHSSNGYQPNGTNAYANTFLTPSTALTLNSAHLAFYSRTNSTGNFADMGVANNTTNLSAILIMSKWSDNKFYGQVNDYDFNDNTVADSLGLFCGSRTSSNVQKTFKNGTVVTSKSVASTLLVSYQIPIGARYLQNVAGFPAYTSYSNRQCAFASIGDGLTDLESQLFYQITEKFQVALSRNINTLQSFYYNPAYNNETNAFLFSTQITDNTIQTATDTLVTDLKTAGVYTKMKAIYPMVGGTATTCKFNLVNAQDTDAAYRLVFSGGGTFSSNGYQLNGINAFADTFLAPSAFYSTNMHLSYYSRTSAIGSVGEIGSSQVISGGTTYSSLATARNSIFGFTTNGLVNYVSQANSLGFFIGQKLTNSSRKVFRNGVVNNSTTTTDSNALPNTNIYIGALNDNGTPAFYSSKECAFASIGDGLSDAEALAFYNAVNAFQVSLTRNV